MTSLHSRQKKKQRSTVNIRVLDTILSHGNFPYLIRIVVLGTVHQMKET